MMIHRILAKALERARIRATIGAVDADEGVERPTPGAAPTAFRIWRAGENATSKGTHRFTAKSAALLLEEQSVRGGTLYSIDVDHMSLSDDAPPENHRAVGWHRLDVRQSSSGPELWAVDVEWSPDVKAALESRPPGFRYFSPAYDVARESGEIVGYLNTALTNNPATYQVTALATRAAAEEEKPMKMEDILAALKAGAEGDDEQAKKCKAAYAALTASDDEEKKPDEEKAKASEGDDDKDAKKATDDEKPADEKKKEEAKASAAAALDAASVIKLVDRRLQSVRDEAERDRLIASRKDITDQLATSLKTKPLAVVREILEAIPVSAKRNPAADLEVRATRGAGQGDGGASQLDPKIKADMDARMGLRTRQEFVTHERTKTSFHAMTADQARSVLASKSKGAK